MSRLGTHLVCFTVGRSPTEEIMKVDKKVAIAALLAVSLASCAGRGPNETGGAVLGGALGGVVGSQFGQGRGQLAMVGLGALLGAFAGSQAGKSLDKSRHATF